MLTYLIGSSCYADINYINKKGYVNSDGVINVLDAVMVVNIILSP